MKCSICYKDTPEEELEENSKYISYLHQKICDRCADKIDQSVNENKQDKCVAIAK
jgi:hypothetical protein